MSPVVVWLASGLSADVTGRIISVRSGRISVLDGWVNGPTAHVAIPRDTGQLDSVLRRLLAAAPPNAAMSETREQ